MCFAKLHTRTQTNPRKRWIFRRKCNRPCGRYSLSLTGRVCCTKSQCVQVCFGVIQWKWHTITSKRNRINSNNNGYTVLRWAFGKKSACFKHKHTRSVLVMITINDPVLYYAKEYQFVGQRRCRYNTRCIWWAFPSNAENERNRETMMATRIRHFRIGSVLWAWNTSVYLCDVVDEL